MMNEARRQPVDREREEREQSYRSLFVHNPDAIFSVDRMPRFTSANPAALRFSGYTEAELLALSPGDLIVPEYVEQVGAAFQRAMAGEATSGEIAIRRKDGGRVDLNLTLVPIIVGGEVTGVFGIAQDVTERHRAESERAALLAEAEAARARAELAEHRAAFLAEAGELLSSSLDYETTLASVVRLAVPRLADWCIMHIRAESGAVRLLSAAAVEPEQLNRLRELRDRYPNQLLTGSGITAVIRSGTPRFVPHVTDAMLAAITENEEQLEALRSLHVASLMLAPLTAHGRTFGAITLVYAESGRHYDRADLNLVMDLAHRAAIAVDNARLYQEAQRAVELRDHFLATVSHDLRTPVTAIKSYAQLLQRALKRAPERGTAPSAEDLLDGLDSIERGASRITEQINELLDLSQLQSGRPLELERRPTDLVVLTRQAVAAQEQITGQHRIHVTAEVPQLMGLWDNIRLERVLSNLLSNALKYSPEGGEIDVRIARAECCPPSSDPCAVLTVQDHGIGIPAQDLPHIFERFYRASNTRGRPGTGIGLAGVRDIVQQHGGTIEVASREGEGSTFTVRLPLTPPEDAATGE